MKKLIVLFSLVIASLFFLQEWIYVSDFQYQNSHDPVQLTMFETGQQAFTASFDRSKIDNDKDSDEDQQMALSQKLRSCLDENDALFLMQADMKDPVSYTLHCYVHDPDGLLAGFSTKDGQADLSKADPCYTTMKDAPSDQKLKLLNEQYHNDEWIQVSFYPLEQIDQAKGNPYFDLYLVSDYPGSNLAGLNNVLKNGYSQDASGEIWRNYGAYFNLSQTAWQIPWLYGLSLFLMLMVMYRKRMRACMIMKIQGCTGTEIFMAEFGRLFAVLLVLPVLLTGFLFLLFGSGYHYFSNLIWQSLLSFLQVHLLFVLMAAIAIGVRIHLENRQTTLKNARTGRESIWLAAALVVMVLSMSMKPISINTACLVQNIPAYQTLKNNPGRYSGFLSLAGNISRYGDSVTLKAQPMWADVVYEQDGLMQDFSQLPSTPGETDCPILQVNSKFMESYSVFDSSGKEIDVSSFEEPHYLIPESISSGPALEARLEKVLGTSWPRIQIKNGTTLYSNSPYFYSSHPLQVTDAVILVYPDLRLHTTYGPDFQMIRDQGEKTDRLIEQFYQQTNGEYKFQMTRSDTYYANCLYRLKAEITTNIIQV